ncbi:MAG: hypothetical protein EOO67_12005 [Microbacterium sp.]|nr:MAG: hypothetical protein EOO67_12005 [Microbacterium sp.]
MKRHSLATWIAPILVGMLLTGCTFSFGGTTEVTESSQEATGANGSGSQADRTSDQPSTPHVSKLCDDLTAVYLSNISDAENSATIINDWVKVTAAAPKALKKDLTIVGAYMVAGAQGNYAVLKNASDVVDKALDHVDRYVTKVCRA